MAEGRISELDISMATSKTEKHREKMIGVGGQGARIRSKYPRKVTKLQNYKNYICVMGISKGEGEKRIEAFETTMMIISPINVRHQTIDKLRKLKRTLSRINASAYCFQTTEGKRRGKKP